MDQALITMRPSRPIGHELGLLGHHLRALGSALVARGAGPRWRRLYDAATVFTTLGLVVAAAAIVSAAPQR